MIGDSNEDVYRVKAEVDFTDIEELKSLLEDLKKKFADLNRVSTPPALRSKRDDVAKQIVDTERLISVQEKAIQTTQRLSRTQDSLTSKNVTPFDKSWNKPLGVTPSPVVTGADKIRQIGQEAIKTRQYLAKMNEELEAQKDIIEDIAKSPPSEGEIGITRNQRKLIDAFKSKFTTEAQSLSLNKPGERIGATEDALKRAQSRVIDKRVVEPGRFVGSQFVKTRMSTGELSLPGMQKVGSGPFVQGMTKLTTQVKNKMDLVVKDLITKGVAQTSATWKPITARSTSGLYPEDYLRGRSDADRGIETPTKRTPEMIEKYGEAPVPTSIPQSRSTLPDRMWYFRKDVAANFVQASKMAEEMYLSGDKDLEVYLRAITDQMYGTNTQTEEEMKKSEGFFPKRKTKEGIDYKRDYGIKPHPVHALYMLRDLFRQVGVPDESMMPQKRIAEVYDVLTGNKKESDFWEPMLDDVTKQQKKDKKGNLMWKDLRTPVKSDLRAHKPTSLEKSFDAATNKEIFNELENGVRSLLHGYSEMNPSEAWGRWRDLSRQVTGFQRAEGVRARPLRNMLSDVAENLIKGIGGFGGYFDPQKMMDPSYMPNKRLGGWMGRLGTSSSFGNENELQQRGMGSQKFMDVGGIIGKFFDSTGFNKMGNTPNETFSQAHVGHKGGYPIDTKDGLEYTYSDTGESANYGTPNRPCPKCGKAAKVGEPDECLGKLEGVKGACCGHGVEEDKYVALDNGKVLTGKNVDIFVAAQRAKKATTPAINALSDIQPVTQPEQARVETTREAKKELGPQYVPPAIPTTKEQTERIVEPIVKQEPQTLVEKFELVVTKVNEAVANQPHYMQPGQVQPIRKMQQEMSPEEFTGFLKGNVTKYTSRAGKKEGESEEKDLAKAKVYQNWLDEFKATGDITVPGETTAKKITDSGSRIAIGMAGAVAAVKKAADQAAEVTRTTELPEQGGRVPSGMTVPGIATTPIETQINKAMIPIQTVGDTLTKTFGDLYQKIDILPKFGMPGEDAAARGIHGPFGAEIPAKVMGAETPTESTPGQMAAQPWSIGDEQKVMLKNMNYGRDSRGKKGRGRQWPSIEELVTKSGAFSNQPEDKRAEKIAEHIKEIAEILPPTERLRDFFSRTYKEGQAAPEENVVQVYAKHLRGLFDKNVMKKVPPTEPTEVQPLPPEVASQMVGETYKIKLTYTNLAEFEKASAELAKYPGMIQVTRKQYELFGGVAEDVSHTLEATGKFTKPEDVNTIRTGVADLATRKGSLPDMSRLQIEDKRLSLGQRLFQLGQLSDKLNWKLVRGQMALLGIAFSMQGAIRMVQGAWSMLGNSISKLQPVFENIAMAMAFGPKSAQGFLKGMLGDSKNIVGAWKSFTGLMATVNSLLAYMAYKIFSDKRVIDSIERLVTKLIDKLADADFMDRIINLMVKIIDSLPSIIDGLVWIVELLLKVATLPGMDKILSWMVLMGIAAQFLMTPLALLGGAFQLLSWILEGLGVTLATTFGKGWILGALTYLTESVAEFAAIILSGGTSVGLSAAALAGSIAAGFLIGLAVVRVMVETGITGWLASVGDIIRGGAPWLMDALSVLTWPFAVLGVMVLDLVTGQFDKILPDIKIVLLKTIKAVAAEMEAVFNLLPWGVGKSGATIFGTAQVNIQKEIDVLASQGGATHRAMGGAIKGGQAYIVGEKGPEVFVPSGAGSIIPNHMLGYAAGDVSGLFGGDPFGTIPQTFAPVTTRLMEVADTNKVTADTNVQSAEKTETAATQLVYGAAAYDRIVARMGTFFDQINRSIGNNYGGGKTAFSWDKTTGTYQTPGMTKPYTEPNAPSTTAIPNTLYGSDLDELRLRKQTAEQLGDFKSYSWVASLPKLALGGLIERTGAAVVHKGESVVPESQSGNVSITNYNSVLVNNKVDEKYLENMLGRKYYGSY